MRALKALVIGMGVLIVAGTVTLAVLIVQRAGGGGGLGGAGGQAPFALALGQPEGARIAGIAAAEGGAVAVWVARPDGEDRVLLVDTRRGRIAGEIRPGR